MSHALRRLFQRLIRDPRWASLSISLGLTLGIVPLALAEMNVTDQVVITRSSPRYSRDRSGSSETITLTSRAPSALIAPVQLVFSNLSAGVTVVNASGTTPEGEAYIDFLTTGELAPGQSISLPVKYLNPSRKRIRFDPMVWSGVENRPPVATLVNPLAQEDEPLILALTGFDPEEGDETHLTVTMELQDTGTPPDFMMFQVEPDNVTAGAFLEPFIPTEITNPDRLVMFVPSPHFFGIARFYYSVEDSAGLSDVAEIFLETVDVPDAPFVSLNAWDHQSIGNLSIVRTEPTVTRITLIWGDIDSQDFLITLTELPSIGELYRTDISGGISPATLVTPENSTFTVLDSTQLVFYYVSPPTVIGDPLASLRWKVSDFVLETPEAVHTMHVHEGNVPPDPGEFFTDVLVAGPEGLVMEFTPVDPDTPYPQLRMIIESVPENGELSLVDGYTGIIVGALEPGDRIAPSCFFDDCRPIKLLFAPDDGVDFETLLPTELTFHVYDPPTESFLYLLPVHTVTIHFNEGSWPY